VEQLVTPTQGRRTDLRPWRLTDDELAWTKRLFLASTPWGHCLLLSNHSKLISRDRGAEGSHSCHTLAIEVDNFTSQDGLIRYD
jgi:hypothetical protein